MNDKRSYLVQPACLLLRELPLVIMRNVFGTNRSIFLYYDEGSPRVMVHEFEFLEISIFEYSKKFNI